jgi:adenylate cyclase
MAEGEVRQRLAAILAADVVGYSRLMGDDEPSTIASLTASRAIFRTHIEANDGRVVDMAGDSVLAVFASATGAVKTAVDTQAEVNARNDTLPDRRRMHFRVGVNLGDIREAEDGTVYGDGVNVAARLESLAEPGGVMLSESAHLQVRRDPALNFEDAGEHDVKNITEPVRAFRLLGEGETAAPARKTAGRRYAYLAAMAALVLAVGGGSWWLGREAPPEPMVTADGTPTDDPVLAAPTGPAIAVLPFDDLSEEPKQEYFADGLTEDIITGLSRFNSLRVIARNSTFQYKGQAVDVREVGEALGVRYVLEGSVRRSGDSLRVAAQLLDARDGTHLWAENYAGDITTTDIFAVQEGIMERIVGTLGDEHGVVTRAGLEETGARHTDNLVAYECVLRAYAYYDLITPAEHLAVRGCLEEAVALDPAYAEAWAWLSLMHKDEHNYAFNPRPEADKPLVRAIAASQNAIKADATSQIGHESLAMAHYFAGDMEQFRVAAERALSLNPNNSRAVAGLGQLYAWAGDWDRGIALIDKAVYLNPNHPTWYHFVYASRHYFDKDYEAALLSAKRFNYPGFYWQPAWLAMIYAQLDRLDEARVSVVELNALYPGWVDVARADTEKWIKDKALISAMMSGLEKAGLFDEPEAPSRPVIAVLPFDNMSGDPEQEYFADGITEDITTRLSRFYDLAVIARNSAFQYKGKAVNVQTVAKELGVDFVVEGSVRKSEGRVRVTAQLLEANGATHVWANSWDRELSTRNVFDIQDEVTNAIVGAIAGVHGAVARTAAVQSRQQPMNLDSYECVLRTFVYERQFSGEAYRIAKSCLEEILANEPDYVDAVSAFAMIATDGYTMGWGMSDEERDEMLVQALTAGHKAIALAPDDARGHLYLAYAEAAAGNAREFHVHAERAMELNPNDADVMGNVGAMMAFSGEYDYGLALIEKAILLNPHHPEWWYYGVAAAHWSNGRHRDALDAVNKVNQTDLFWTYFWRAVVFIELGDESSATAAPADLERVYPGFTIETYREEGSNFMPTQDFLERAVSALRRAGLPEGGANH